MKTVLYFTIGCITALFVLPTIPYMDTNIKKDFVEPTWDVSTLNDSRIQNQEMYRDSLILEIRTILSEIKDIN